MKQKQNFRSFLGNFSRISLKSRAKKDRPEISVIPANKLRLQNPIRSVGTKLTLVFFCCIVGLVAFLGVFSYNKSKSIIQQKMQDSTEQTIMQTGDKLDLIFNNYSAVSLQLLQDQQLVDNIRNYRDTSINAYDRMIAGKNLEVKLTSYANSDNSIQNIMLIPMDNSGKILEVNRPANEETDKVYDQDWYKKVVAGDGMVVWLPPQKNGFMGKDVEPVFAFGRVLKDLNTGSGDFVLVFEIKSSFLRNSLDKIKLGTSGHIYIADEAGKLVSTPDEKQIGQALSIKADNIGDDTEKAVGKTINDQLVVFKKLQSTGWTVIASAPLKELTQETRQIAIFTLWIAIAAVIVAIIAGLWVMVTIGRPLAALRNLMKEGEHGNLTVRTNIRRKDEIGQLAQSFNQMMEQITNLVRHTNESAANVLKTSGELLQASKQTATSAREIAVATEEIATGASSLAVEAEKGNSLTQEIGTQMKNVVAANEQMGVSASQVQKASEQGTLYMADLTSKTNSTEEMTRSMVEKVDHLKESTSSIRKILDVLNSISKQTNILSLNATIEAARAGAAGKGFMVVADEIRRLAEQSKQSIEVVATITETIQGEIDETVAVLSNAYPVFQEQIGAVKEAELIFKQVQENMGGFIDQLDQVSLSINDLEYSQHTLNEAMTNVSAVSEESSATSQEVASLSNEQLGISEGLVRLSESLEQLSTSLGESLARFKV